jgi:hypothetical protein
VTNQQFRKLRVMQCSQGWLEGARWLFEQFPDAVAVWGPHESDWVLEDVVGYSGVFGRSVLDRDATVAASTWAKRCKGLPACQRFDRYDPIFTRGVQE